MRCSFPVFESLTYGRADRCTVAVLSDSTSSIRSPVYKLTSMARPLAGIIAASISRMESCSTHSLRTFAPPIYFPESVNPLWSRTHYTTTYSF